jgi:hypothetical protein
MGVMNGYDSGVHGVRIWTMESQEGNAKTCEKQNMNMPWDLGFAKYIHRHHRILCSICFSLRTALESLLTEYDITLEYNSLALYNS